jgi:tripartite-type tricarboxylate transporter receptor subunit TctC
MTPWFMLLAPAATPAPVVALLNRHVNDVLKSPEVKKTLLAAGIELSGGSSEQALAYFQQQREQVARLAREMNVSFKN